MLNGQAATILAKVFLLSAESTSAAPHQICFWLKVAARVLILARHRESHGSWLTCPRSIIAQLCNVPLIRNRDKQSGNQLRWKLQLLRQLPRWQCALRAAALLTPAPEVSRPARPPLLCLLLARCLARQAFLACFAARDRALASLVARSIASFASRSATSLARRSISACSRAALSRNFCRHY